MEARCRRLFGAFLALGGNDIAPRLAAVDIDGVVSSLSCPCMAGDEIHREGPAPLVAEVHDAVAAVQLGRVVIGQPGTLSLGEVDGIAVHLLGNGLVYAVIIAPEEAHIVVAGIDVQIVLCACLLRTAEDRQPGGVMALHLQGAALPLLLADDEGLPRYLHLCRQGRCH